MSYIIKRESGNWEIVVGMEVHCQVISNSKVFSPGAIDFAGEPNSRVSLVDAAMPGMLPVINKFCVEQAVKTGLGLKAKINKISRFDRKSYFYADSPQGYQITQQFMPIVGAGEVEITTKDGTKNIRIHHMHLEQDAGKSIHDMYVDKTCIDLNRVGTGLMEIVSEPDIRSPQEAAEFLKKIRAIVRYLETCDGEMQEGSMRADVNVSVRKVGEDGFRTRCEIKNMNSVKFIQQAIEFEANRQIDIYEDGEELDQNTLAFDKSTGETRPLRSKEDANDYRYFPDPDLLPLVLEDDFIERIKSELPELPDDKKHRYMNDFGLSAYDAEVITDEKEYALFFESAVEQCKDSKKQAKSVANLMTSELFGILKKEGLSISDSPIDFRQISDLSNLIADGSVSSKIAKQIFLLMMDECKGGMPSDIVEQKGLKQVNDVSAIEDAVRKVVIDNPNQVADFKAGKDKLIGFFVGQVMKETQGKANPASINEILKKVLSE